MKYTILALAAAVLLAAGAIGAQADAVNLISNPSFETFDSTEMVGAAYNAVWFWKSWTIYIPSGSDLTTVREENVWSLYPAGGTPTFHSGQRAITVFGNNGNTAPARAIFAQSFAVTQPSIVNASAWVLPWCVEGLAGFGQSLGDFVEVYVEELDAEGNLLGLRHSSGLLETASTTMVQLVVPAFTTDPRTAFVQFGMSSQTEASYVEGHVTWDDAFLSITPVPEPASLMVLFGGLSALAAARYRKR